MGEKVLVVGDRPAQARELLLDLVALEAGEAAQAHLEDGLGLLGREAKALDQALGGLSVGSCEERMMEMTSSMWSRAMR